MLETVAPVIMAVCYFTIGVLVGREKSKKTHSFDLIRTGQNFVLTELGREVPHIHVFDPDSKYLGQHLWYEGENIIVINLGRDCSEDTVARSIARTEIHELCHWATVDEARAGELKDMEGHSARWDAVIEQELDYVGTT